MLADTCAMCVQLCDQHGTKIMQRYIKFRRLQQLMGEIGTLSVAKRTSAPAQASLAVDPRQVSNPAALTLGILQSLYSWPLHLAVTAP